MFKKNKYNKDYSKPKVHIFVGEYGDEVNDKIVCIFKNKIIGEWVMELLDQQVHFKRRSYEDYKPWYYFESDNYGQTLFKFCFDKVITDEDLDMEITKAVRWTGGYCVSEDNFSYKIRKIILLQNKIR